MHIVDVIIFVIYIIAMLSVGVYFFYRNKSTDDYYVGGRKIKPLHVGLSVVATDVGGGFSIGLGGLGFVMGLSGSWLLFTGLVGAWLSAVLLIPAVVNQSKKQKLLTFPQFLESRYSKNVAFIAGILSAIGYLGFTSSQILAGAKLASATIDHLNLSTAVLAMGAIVVVYTVLGGLKAVIYTDTVQWIILMSGLIFVGLPVSYTAVGGFDVIQKHLPEQFLSLGNVSWKQLLNWALSIIPIWFIGMTLYQRIYASRDESSAKKAWFIAGIFEYPIMAFTGVVLGMIARVAFETSMFSELVSTQTMDEELGIPFLLKTVLPVGLLGVMLAAYFSAIMSTADSCLMAVSGNILTDIFNLHHRENAIRISQILTMVVGVLAVLIALKMPNVLELMLHSYAFMVSGMLIPVLAALIQKKPSATAAVASMIGGGGVSLYLIITNVEIIPGIDPIVYGLSVSVFLYILVNKIFN
jgi:solute:Na+ symporter, SSS family